MSYNYENALDLASFVDQFWERSFPLKWLTVYCIGIGDGRNEEQVGHHVQFVHAKHTWEQRNPNC
jgi:hypothetical protein